MSGGADGTCSDGDAFQLRMEIVDLRKKLKLLDGGGEKSELLSLLQERDDELSLKNQQLSALNAKFRQITDGLQTIESERQADKAAYAQLEKDKGRVDQHLGMREKEIETIAQRCAELEEKIQGSVPLRVAHNNLLKEKEDLERQMEAAQQELLSLEPIQEELAASRAETEDALVKLKKAEDDAKAESDRLRADVSTLQDEKAAHQTKIVELEASISKISAERDADRKDHRDATTALRNDLQKSREETEVATKQMQEYGSQIATMKRNHTDAMAQGETEHRKEMEDTHRRSTEARDALQSTVGTLEEELASAKAKVTELMDDLKSDHDDKEAMHQQHEATKIELQQKLTSREEDISTLQSSLTDASGNSDAQSKQIETLRNKVRSLEGDVSDKSSVEKDLVQTRQTVEDLERDISMMEQSHADQVSRLEEAVKESHTSKAEMEKTLEAEIASLEKDKSSTVARHTSEVDTLQCEIASLKESIENLVQRNANADGEHESTITRLEEDASIYQSTIAELESKIVALTKDHDREMTTKDREIRELKEVNLVAARREVSTLKSTVSELEKKNANAEMAAAEIVAELEGQMMAAKEECASLRTKVATIQEDYESEQTTSQSLQSRLKSSQIQLESARSEVVELQSAIHQSEVDRAETQTELEAAQSQVSTLLTERDDLETSLRTARKQISSDARTIEKKQTSLDDRTKLLGDMVKQNRDVEANLEEARRVTAELQDELDKLTQKGDRDRLEKDALLQELEAKEDQHLCSIEQERRAREDVEAVLSDVKAKLDRYRVDYKSAEELQKENATLVDKIRRQEAYLKRKLEREKVSRASMNGVLRPTTRLSNGSVGTGRISGQHCAPLSEVVFSSSGYGDTSQGGASAPDDELDEILQDDV